jgi:hypothetical protein
MKHYQNVQSRTNTNMGSPARARSRMTPDAIRRRIEEAKITDVDKKVLRHKLEQLLSSELNFSTDDASKWIDEGIETFQSTVADRARLNPDAEKLIPEKRA